MNGVQPIAARVLYHDAAAEVRAEADSVVSRLGFDWQRAAVTVTYDAIYIAPVKPSFAFPPSGDQGIDPKINKLKILRRCTEETPHGVAMRIRYRNDEREVREIELVPSDRSRFARALAVSVE